MSHLSDIAVRLQVYLERLKTAEAKDFNFLLRFIEAEFRAALSEGELVDMPRVEVREIVRSMRKALEGSASAAVKEFADRLEEIALFSYQSEAAGLSTGITGIVSKLGSAKVLGQVLERPLSSTGELLMPWIKRMVESEVLAVESLLRKGLAEGWDNSRMIRALTGTRSNRYTDGLMARLGRQNSTLVRTAIQHAHSVSRQQVWNENSDIIEGYRWLSTLDNKTSEQCRALDGRLFKLGAGPLPPIHPNCRSVTVAQLIKSLDVLSRGATRASMDGPVSAKTNYYDWLKDQPAEFQDSVIGPVRGALLRNGGLTVAEFTRLQLNSVFEPLTLEEMRKLVPLAFRRAGV